MGYTSQVAIEAKKKEAKIILATAKTSEALSELVSDSTRHELESSVIFHWEWIKWYERYESIDLMMSLLNQLDDESWYFVRVGEDYDDTVTYGSNYDSQLYVSREISW